MIKKTTLVVSTSLSLLLFSCTYAMDVLEITHEYDYNQQEASFFQDIDQTNQQKDSSYEDSDQNNKQGYSCIDRPNQPRYSYEDITYNQPRHISYEQLGQFNQQEVISYEELLNTLFNRSKRLFINEEQVTIQKTFSREIELKTMSLKAFLKKDFANSFCANPFEKNYEERAECANRVVNDPISDINGIGWGVGRALFNVFRLVTSIDTCTGELIKGEVNETIQKYGEALRSENSEDQTALGHKLLELHTKAIETMVPGYTITLVEDITADTSSEEDTTLIEERTLKIPTITVTPSKSNSPIILGENAAGQDKKSDTKRIVKTDGTSQSPVLGFTDPINLDDDSQKECSIQ
ncbi:hypothetical protein H0W26_04170 [Candidatus Dependentiae bacterium]|nr:hypothetical protein [Candidatus Dependentiae bacterium]